MPDELILRIQSVSPTNLRELLSVVDAGRRIPITGRECPYHYWGFQQCTWPALYWHYQECVSDASYCDTAYCNTHVDYSKHTYYSVNAPYVSREFVSNSISVWGLYCTI